jgi:glycosyltransferase involved in cell wall biosynthesis
LFEPNDVDGLAQALASALSSPERRQSMREAIRSLRAGQLSWTNVAAETLRLYCALGQRCTVEPAAA